MTSIEVLASASGEFLDGVVVYDAPEVEQFLNSHLERYGDRTTDAIVTNLDG